MDVDINELIHGDIKLPLYVDRLLESHDKLGASRNREFKVLIRSFQTIRDSDFEVPECLAEIVSVSISSMVSAGSVRLHSLALKAFWQLKWVLERHCSCW